MNKIAKIAALAALALTCVASTACADFNVDKSITVISREEGSGTRGAFVELTGVEQKIDGKKVDMNKSEMAVGFAKGVTATPDMIKNAMEHSKQKTGEGITEVNTWAPMVNADDGYLAIVWAEKSGATAVIAYNIVLK